MSGTGAYGSRFYGDGSTGETYVPGAPTTVTGAVTLTSTSTLVVGAITGAGPTPYSTQVLTDNPRAYWRLVDSTGSVVPDSATYTGTRHDGTILGSPSRGQARIFTGSSLSYRFHGTRFTDEAVDWNDPGTSTLPLTGYYEGTVEFLIKPTAVNGGYIHGLFQIGNLTGTGAINVWLDDTTFGMLRVNWSGNFTSSTVNLVAGTSYHIAIVRDWGAGTQTIYINGVASGTSFGLAFSYANGYVARFPYYLSNAYPTDTYMSDVAVYDYPLTSSQVSNHYSLLNQPAVDLRSVSSSTYDWRVVGRAELHSISTLGAAEDQPVRAPAAVNLQSTSDIFGTSDFSDPEITVPLDIQLTSESFLNVESAPEAETGLHSYSWLNINVGTSATVLHFILDIALDLVDPILTDEITETGTQAGATPPGGGENALKLMMSFSGHALVQPPRSTYGYMRALPSVGVTVQSPVTLAGKPYLAPIWVKSDSTMTMNVGSGHIVVVPDPDPIHDPPTPTTHPSSGGTATYRWLASDLPYTGDYFNTWPSHGAGPDWHSTFPYRPKVRLHQHYGSGSNAYTYGKLVFFNPTYVEHMWLDMGRNMPQPYTWVFCGIPLNYEGSHDGHYLLDAGRARATDTIANVRKDRVINEGIITRSMMLLKRDSEIITTNHSLSEGVYVKTPHAWAPRPRVFAGVFNGANSYVGALDNHAQHITKGRVTNRTARYFVMGRALNRLSDNYASHMALMEVRLYTKALSPTEITNIYKQMAATYKFNLY